uniref:HTH OST-type domain-containing protein n=1 Tax=Cajanus cajan TaxID=3821 RepID=A0A151TQP2_CAJCA|nr:hypothetical protein KK1_008585 [Cajanus cajan]
MLSKPNRDALANTGIQFTHVPKGGKNSGNILVEIMFWVSQNPPPAHLFLISGDRSFACILHWLRMNNYNILLASPKKASGVLFSAATIMWQWSSLLKGENLSGKHFNHPPDGPFGSWYGNFKVPLENPFLAAEPSTSLQNVEINEPSLDLKSGAVSKSLVRQVKHILSSHPKGISITDLHAELAKCDEHLDKSLYGFRSFSRFLLSIPHIQLQPLGSANFRVFLLASESPEPFDSSVVPLTSSSVKNEERGGYADGTPSNATFRARSMNDDSKSFQPVPSQGKTIGEYVDGKSSFPSSVERHEFQPQNELQKYSLASEKVADVADAQIPKIQPPSMENKFSKTKIGSLKTRSKKSSGNDNFKSEDASHKIVEKHTTSVDKNLSEKRVDGIAETYNKRPTFFRWIRSWWPFWRSNAKFDDLDAHQNKVVKPDQNVIHSRKPELFSSVSFWNDLESFIFTPKGSLIVSQSKSRGDMAHKLQNDGPLVLRSLTRKDIIQLVELLTAEKKWLVEISSEAFPFRLTQSVQKNSLMDQSHGANGLRSVFLSKLSQNDILEDCQKLVNEILREHPKGYRISSFPRLFVDRYGYHLNLQKLGYKKLATLLQIMPDVKVDSTYIFPSSHAVSASDGETSILKTENFKETSVHAVSNSDGELSDSPPKDDNMESPWQELDRASVNNSHQSNMESKLRKPKCDEQDSSFWQALDLWHSSKERENSVTKLDNYGDSRNTLADILNSSTESIQGTLSIDPAGNYRQKSQKNYSFVADPGLLPEKDRLVDGILNGLNSLKKADKSKMQN